MKSNYFIAATAIALTLSSCGGMNRLEKRGPLQISPSELNLAEKNYTVNVDYQINVPGKAVPRKARLLYSPQFESKNYTMALTPVAIVGKNFERMALRKQRLDGIDVNEGMLVFPASRKSQTLTVNDQVPFETWLVNSKLVGYTVASTCCKTAAIGSQIMANGVYYMPQSVGPVLTKLERKEITANGEIHYKVTFRINSPILSSLFDSNNAEIQQLKSTISQFTNNDSIYITKIDVTGISSPDGPYKFNDELSKERTEAGKNMLITEMAVPSSIITSANIAEDWSGLEYLASKAKLEDAATISAIANSSATDAEKDRQLYNLPNFQAIAKTILPQLRRVTFDIYYTSKTYKNEWVPL